MRANRENTPPNRVEATWTINRKPLVQNNRGRLVRTFITAPIWVVTAFPSQRRHGPGQPCASLSMPMGHHCRRQVQLPRTPVLLDSVQTDTRTGGGLLYP